MGTQMDIDVSNEMTRLLNENGIDQSLAKNILALTDKVNKKSRKSRGAGTILKNKERTNEKRDNELYYSHKIMRSEEDSKAYLDANRPLLEMLQQEGQKYWMDYRLINFDNEYYEKTKNLVKAYNDECCFDVEAEEHAVIESARRKNAYPEFNVSLGNTHHLHYNGTKSLFTIGKYYYRSNNPEPSNPQQRCELYKYDFDLKQIPVLILGLSSLYEFVMAKLEKEGQTKNISFYTPKDPTLEPIEDDVGEDLPPLNKPW